jgi:glycosyltransferase involved in cell wall biosynthesis
MISADAGGVPFFSILIASYNSIVDLKVCIASISSQTFEDYELLVSDGGSSDGTAEYLQRAQILGLSWFKSEPDAGIYDALNVALEHARGKWVLVLGCDDRLANANALQIAYEQIQLSKLFSGVAYFDLLIASPRRTRLKKYPDLERFVSAYHGGPPIHHQTAFIARSSLEKSGNFDLRYRLHSDYQLMMRVLRSDGARKLEGAIVIFCSSGCTSRISNIWLSMREMYVIRKLFGYPPLPFKLVMTYGLTFLKAFYKFLRNLIALLLKRVKA